MKKVAMTLLTFAVAVPMMFAADTPKADPTAPAAKTKKHHKAKKTTAAPATPATPAK
jgi:hypothetical protein